MSGITKKDAPAIFAGKMYPTVIAFVTRVADRLIMQMFRIKQNLNYFESLYFGGGFVIQ